MEKWEVNLLDIPNTVIDGNILPHLEWNDLLRLRHVCTWIKDVIQAYLQVNPDLAPELEINAEDKSFGAFLKMNIPTTKIFLNIPDQDVFHGVFHCEDGGAPEQFIERFGPHVKHLRMAMMPSFLCIKEGDFLVNLDNLQSLEVDRYGVEREMGFCDADVKSKSVYSGEFMLLSKTDLESVALPFDNFMAAFSKRHLLYSKEDFAKVQILFWSFHFIKTCIEKREEHRRSSSEANSNKPYLKLFDFRGYEAFNHDGVGAFLLLPTTSPKFLELLAVCGSHDVMLENVQAKWFLLLETSPEFQIPDLGKPIRSLVNLHPTIFLLQMPNLEGVKITSTTDVNLGQNWIQNRPEWPALKTVDMTVTVGKDATGGAAITKAYFHLFFKDVSRTALTEFRLDFKAGGKAVPKMEEIVRSCPNIKKFTIVNWPGTNKALTIAFSGLLELEEVLLENCKGLGNVAFVGEDVGNPIFFKLTKLRRLSLKGLDEMPKITDTLFTLVICNLPLTHLHLTSSRWSPSKSVTKAGIKALLKGRFAESIQKFSFQDWSLADVGQEEFKKLEEGFRSYYML